MQFTVLMIWRMELWKRCFYNILLNGKYVEGENIFTKMQRKLEEFLGRIKSGDYDFTNGDFGTKEVLVVNYENTAPL